MSATYSHMPTPPNEIRAGSILACLTHSLAYRYRWASEALTDDLLEFRPCADAMDLRALLEHMRDLAWWLRLTLVGDKPQKLEGGAAVLREQTLEWLGETAARFELLSEADLAELSIHSHGREPKPVWNVIHGPLADFLTHVGQLASWRRMAGCPAPGAQVFLGLPPERGQD